MAFWTGLGAAFVVVFLVEFADKTQLVLLSLAARGKAFQVWLGAAGAFLLLTLAAAWVGDRLARWIPTWIVTSVAGLLFIVFGVLTLRGEDDQGDGGEPPGQGAGPDREGPEAAEKGVGRAPSDSTRRPLRTGFAAAFPLVLVAEMGDKTQLSVAALASQVGFWPAFLGGSAALLASGGLAVLAGGWIGRKVPAGRIRQVAGWLFIALGALFLISLALPG